MHCDMLKIQDGVAIVENSIQGLWQAGALLETSNSAFIVSGSEIRTYIFVYNV